MIEVWRDIPGFNGKYQINTEGSVRLIFPSGITREVKPFKRNNKDKKFYVILRLNGKRHFKSMPYLMSRTFLGEPPKGFVAYNKNGCYRENHLNNIGYIDKKELCRRRGRISRKSVCKIDKNGEIVDYYSSAKEAGEANNYSPSMICYYCRGDTKSLFASDGYTYFYDEDEHGLKMLIRKIKKGNGNV